ncbi:MAG TPA: hypothetical protein VNN55_02250 [bacterium]|nr:hypothetical protein [bacterium]
MRAMTKQTGIDHDSRQGGRLEQDSRGWITACAGMTIAMLTVLVVCPAVPAQAQPESNARAWVVWPSGAVAFPTGRFGEKDEEANPPKDGHKTGFDAGLDLGYFVSDFACVGVSYNYARFDLDLVGNGGREGNTSAYTLQAWGRFFLPGGYSHWQPYLFAAAGVGRPKGTIAYDPPVQFSGLPAPTEELESTVDMTSSIAGGIGVLVPASRRLALSFEPRYVVVHAKGTARTDLFSLSDGSQAEVKEDPDGNRLKAKSNTNWWELRFGVVFMLR